MTDDKPRERRDLRREGGGTVEKLNLTEESTAHKDVPSRYRVPSPLYVVPCEPCHEEDPYHGFDHYIIGIRQFFGNSSILYVKALNV